MAGSRRVPRSRSRRSSIRRPTKRPTRPSAVCAAVPRPDACLEYALQFRGRKASGAVRPSASAVASSASAAARPERAVVHRRDAAPSLPPMTTLAELGGWPAVLGPARRRPRPHRRAGPRRHGRDPRGRRHAGAARRLRRRAAHEGRDRRRAHRPARRHARRRGPGAASTPPLRDRLVDIVGTGGDRSHSINVSTLASFVVAGAGVPVCKHGNRAASSACGAADLLEALGVAIELRPDDVAALHRDGRHGVLLRAPVPPGAAPRRPDPTASSGVPTAFNILGPMANPARVRRQVVGVADAVAGRADARRAGQPRCRRGAGRARRRRPRRAHHDHDVDGLGARRRRRAHLDARSRPSSGWRPARAEQLRRRRPADQRRLRPGRAGRRARTAPRHRRAQRRRRAAGRGRRRLDSPTAWSWPRAVLDDGRAAAALDAPRRGVAGGARRATVTPASSGSRPRRRTSGPGFDALGHGPVAPPGIRLRR